MFRNLYLLAALMLLGGCNGMPTAYVKDPVYDQAFVIHSGGPLPMMLMATAIQWNADYAVTVKHLPYLAGSEHQGKGDVQFFRHKAQVPVWRQYAPGETVTAVGFNSLYMPVMGQGQTLPAVVRLDARDGVFYATHNGPTAKGMSGGPVFGGDGDVVGITVAYLTESDLSQLHRADLAGQPRVSIFMPYGEIAKEWRRFQATQAKTLAQR